MNLAKTYLGEKVLEQGIKYILHHEPEKKLPMLLNWAERIASDSIHKKNIQNVRRVLKDREGNWYRFAERLLKNTHPTIKERLAINFFVNASLLGKPRQMEKARELGVSVPWAILMDPTKKCNLRCRGCWAGDYQTTAEWGKIADGLWQQKHKIKA